MRCFLAIKLAEDTVGALEAVQDQIPLGRLVPPENLHLTLAFLDECSPDQLEAVHEALSGLAAPVLEVGFAGIGSFGGAHPSSLHAAVAETPPLTALHRKIRSLLHGAGLALPRARFAPHVTLARLPRVLTPADEARLAAFLSRHALHPLPGFVATEVVLFRSTLGHGAPRHDPLCAYPLTGAPPGPV